MALANENNLIIVLILFLVEDGVGECKSKRKKRSLHCLNPFSSGGWCRRLAEKEARVKEIKVLILFLVEDGVGEFIKNLITSQVVS